MAIDHPAEALPSGYTLGPYEIVRVLGRGGFGITYQARRRSIAGDMVAIKELYPAAIARRARNYSVVAPPGTDPKELENLTGLFVREANLVCAINHPNIVSGLEAFESNGTGYLVMRYISGNNLQNSLRAPNGFRPSRDSVAGLLAPLVDALATLHAKGLLHCDIKPDNIFLGVGFAPILIDLGSARIRTGGGRYEDAATYSHYFSALEQVTDRFGPIGPWTDIYQLSAVLYRCITGGKLPDAMDRAKERQDPFNPLAELPIFARAYPPALVRAIDHGLQLHPQNRPRSIDEWSKPFASLLPQAKAATGNGKHGGKTKASRSLHAPRPASDPPTLIGNGAPPPTVGTTPDYLLWAAGILVIVILIVLARILFL